MTRVRSFVIPALICVFVLLLPQFASAQPGSELRFALRSEPKTFNPIMVEDESSEVVRFLTGGVLIRLDRQKQTFTPELATAWKVLDGGKRITFTLRQGVKFSDGTPFTAEDVAFTMNSLMDPNLHSPTGDAFRSGEGQVKTVVTSPTQVSITFPAPIAGLERLFDQVAIMSAHSPKKEAAVLGPFFMAEYKAGETVVLRKNPNYWKKDSKGRSLPYIETVRLDIQQNRDTELLRFRRGEFQVINRLDPDYFDKLSAEMPGAGRDLGPSFDTEQLWFNQVPSSPIDANRKSWFASKNFRQAISAAINREDICRVVYKSHATPAKGPLSPANRFWFNQKLGPQPYGAQVALELLKADGFVFDGKSLTDKSGKQVAFSLITNAGNKSRERMAAMIQADLAKVGIRLSVVTLDFPSLIERITRTFDYDACLLGLVNVDVDPNGQMNVWLSSGASHQWNPEQKKPATAWEAEIDRLMQAQASSTVALQRKQSFDRVQQIVREQAPFIYLVNKNALVAISPEVQNALPSPLRPETYWNIEYIYFSKPSTGVKH